MGIKQDLMLLEDENANFGIEHGKERAVVTENSNAEEHVAIAIENDSLNNGKPQNENISDKETKVISRSTKKKLCCFCCCKTKKPNVHRLASLDRSQILETEVFYIKAKLCSGDTDQSTELQEALKKYSFEDEKLKELNRIVARASDVAMSLLRVQEMKDFLNKGM